MPGLESSNLKKDKKEQNFPVVIIVSVPHLPLVRPFSRIQQYFCL